MPTYRQCANAGDFQIIRTTHVEISETSAKGLPDDVVVVVVDHDYIPAYYVERTFWEARMKTALIAQLKKERAALDKRLMYLEPPVPEYQCNDATFDAALREIRETGFLHQLVSNLEFIGGAMDSANAEQHELRERALRAFGYIDATFRSNVVRQPPNAKNLPAEKREELKTAAVGAVEAANRLIVGEAAKAGVTFLTETPKSGGGVVLDKAQKAAFYETYLLSTSGRAKIAESTLRPAEALVSNPNPNVEAMVELLATQRSVLNCATVEERRTGVMIRLLSATWSLVSRLRSCGVPSADWAAPINSWSGIGDDLEARWDGSRYLDIRTTTGIKCCIVSPEALLKALKLVSVRESYEACSHPAGSRTCSICTLPDDDETSPQALAARACRTRQYSTTCSACNDRGLTLQPDGTASLCLTCKGQALVVRLKAQMGPLAGLATPGARNEGSR